MCLTPLPSFVCVYKFECVQVCVYVDRYVFVLMRFVCVLTGVCLSLCVCVCSQVCVCVNCLMRKQFGICSITNYQVQHDYLFVFCSVIQSQTLPICI